MKALHKSSYILWLPSWYPCTLTPYDGDFIQRHAKAVSEFIPVHVLHLIRDKDGKVTNDIKIEETQNGNLTETIIYYRNRSSALRLPDSFYSIQKYTRLFKKYLNELFQNNGLPDLVHVHIAFKAGLIARWIKKNWRIDYLLTEQWTLYLEEAKPNFNHLSFTSQYLISKIISDASLVLPVSNYLAKAIQRRWPAAKCEIVPNVVNTEIFYPQEKEMDKVLALIHISTLSYQKDPEALFEAAGILKKKGIVFSLDIIGPVNENILALVKKEGIEEQVNLKGEMPQSALAHLIRKSDALVLYSRYETFGCVIIEANACGIPVIVPGTQLMKEIVLHGENGVVVHPGSVVALADALIDFAKNKDKFSKKSIAETAADRYSYQRVGKMYAEIYSRYSSSSRVVRF